MRLGDRHAVATVLCFQELLAQAGQALIARQHEIGGTFRGFRHVLGHLGDAPAGGQRELAAVLVQRAVQQREQGGFAGAVAAHQPDLLARMDGDAGATQQHLGAAAQGDVLQLDHAVAPSVSRVRPR